MNLLLSKLKINKTVSQIYLSRNKRSFPLHWQLLLPRQTRGDRHVGGFVVEVWFGGRPISESGRNRFRGQGRRVQLRLCRQVQFLNKTLRQKNEWKDGRKTDGQMSTWTDKGIYYRRLQKYFYKFYLRTSFKYLYFLLISSIRIHQARNLEIIFNWD